MSSNLGAPFPQCASLNWYSSSYLGGHIIHFPLTFGKAGHATHLKIIPAPLSLPVTVSNATFPA